MLLAAKFNHIDAVKLLLSVKANPRLASHSSIVPYQASINTKLKGLIAKATLLTICLPLISFKKREKVWQQEIVRFCVVKNTNNPHPRELDDFLLLIK